MSIYADKVQEAGKCWWWFLEMRPALTETDPESGIVTATWKPVTPANMAEGCLAYHRGDRTKAIRFLCHTLKLVKQHKYGASHRINPITELEETLAIVRQDNDGV